MDECLKSLFICPGWCGSVDCMPAYEPTVAGSIPNQGTCLGCWSGPWWGVRKRQPHIDVSLPLFPLPSLLSKTK